MAGLGGLLRRWVRPVRARARRIWSLAASGVDFRLRVAETLHPYLPASSNVPFDMTIHAANVMPEQLLRLLTVVQSLPWRSEPHGQVDDFLAALTIDSRTPDVGGLGHLMSGWGSDKERNGYGPLYTAIVDRLLALEDTPGVLEIGLGTNDPKFISTMGRHGVPGASVLAFRDYSARLSVHGADLDTTILDVPGVRCGYVDQLDSSSFSSLMSGLGSPLLHLIIDDGLHLTEANLNTLVFGLQTVAAGGFVVIEDIPARSLGVWSFVEELLSSLDLSARLVRGTVMNALVVGRPIVQVRKLE